MSGKTHPLAPVFAQVGRLVTGVTTNWIDCEPTEKQRIYYANHTSHLDFVVVWSSLPGHIRRWVRPVAGADYWLQSKLRKYMVCNVFNAVLVERNLDRANGVPAGEQMRVARSLIDRLVAALGDCYSLIIFPEGTRGTGETLGRFKSGMYHLCRARPDLEIVPVYIENMNRVLPKAEVLLVPVLCSVTFGPPFRFEPHLTKTEFLAAARDAMLRLKPS